MSDPQQQQMIQDAMKAIAQRRPGRTKLVYDKTKRTIVAVAEGAQSARALNITADDADMFAVATLSSRWLSDQWPRISRDHGIPIRFSSWDDGDALTQYDLGVQPSPADVEGTVILGEGEVRRMEFNCVSCGRTMCPSPIHPGLLHLTVKSIVLWDGATSTVAVHQLTLLLSMSSLRLLHVVLAFSKQPSSATRRCCL